MSTDQATLGELWRVRNAAAASLGLTEDLMQRAVRAAEVDDLVALLEGFSPARATGPEYSRTFEPLIERLWTWRDDATMAKLAAVFGAKGMPWAAVATALSPAWGEKVRADLRHPAWSRLPAFTAV